MQHTSDPRGFAFFGLPNDSVIEISRRAEPLGYHAHMRVSIGCSLLVALSVGCGSSNSDNADAGDIPTADGGSQVNADAAPVLNALLCSLERRSISDLSLLQRITYEYNAQGQLVQFDVDSDGNGQFDYREYRAYGPAGLVVEQRDNGFDGSLNLQRVYVRDPANGNRVSYYVQDSDLTNPSATKLQWNYAYDVDGRLVTQTRDNTPDPVLIFQDRHPNG